MTALEGHELVTYCPEGARIGTNHALTWGAYSRQSLDAVPEALGGSGERFPGSVEPPSIHPARQYEMLRFGYSTCRDFLSFRDKSVTRAVWVFATIDVALDQLRDRMRKVDSGPETGISAFGPLVDGH